MRQTKRALPKGLFASVAGVLAVGLAAAGCGSSGTSGSPAGGTTGSPNTATQTAGEKFTGNPVAIGILQAFTGVYAVDGAGAGAGTAAAVNAINRAGGVLGHKLEYFDANTFGDPADSVPALNQVIAVHHVVGMIGPGGASIAADQPIMDRAHIPIMFEGGSTTFDKNADPYLFRVEPSDDQEGAAIALYAWKKGYRKAAMVFSAISTAQTLVQPIEQEFTKLGGKIVANVDLTPSQSSYSSEAVRIENAHPDVIFTQMEPTTGSVMVTALEQLGGLVPMIGTDQTAGADFYRAITPAVAQKYLVSVVGATSGSAGDPGFLSAYAAVYGQKTPIPASNYAYDGTNMLALAMDQAKSTTGVAIQKAMKLVTNPPGTACTTYATCYSLLKAGKKINYEGASGTMDLNNFNNVYGPFDIVASNASGSGSDTVATVTSKELEAAVG
jgi:ABC-type branched-subunit amino acid transport system substrate-binding protein